MPTLKQEVIDMIDRLPVDATVQDIQYALYVRTRGARGLSECQEGKVLTHEEVQRRIEAWVNRH